MTPVSAGRRPKGSARRPGQPAVQAGALEAAAAEVDEEVEEEEEEEEEFLLDMLSDLDDEAVRALEGGTLAGGAAGAAVAAAASDRSVTVPTNLKPAAEGKRPGRRGCCEHPAAPDDNRDASLKQPRRKQAPLGDKKSVMKTMYAELARRKQVLADLQGALSDLVTGTVSGPRVGPDSVSDTRALLATMWGGRDEDGGSKDKGERAEGPAPDAGSEPPASSTGRGRPAGGSPGRAAEARALDGQGGSSGRSWVPHGILLPTEPSSSESDGSFNTATDDWGINAGSDSARRRPAPAAPGELPAAASTGATLGRSGGPGAAGPASAAPMADREAMHAAQMHLFTSLEEDAYAGECEIRGQLPAWLCGTLYRSGPGLWECGSRQLKHTFDGFAVAGAIEFDGAANRVSARQRFYDSPGYRAARTRGELIVDKFASRPKHTWASWAQDRMRAVTGTRYLDMSFGRIIKFEDQIITLTACMPAWYYTIDPVTLQTQEHKFEDDLSIDYTVPLPSRDSDGVSYNMVGISIGIGFVFYQLARTASGGLSRIVFGRSQVWDSMRPPFTSCCTATCKYFIMPEFPLLINLTRAVLNLSAIDSDDDDESSNSYYMFDWMPKGPVRFHLIHRETGKVSVWQMPSTFYSWHIANAFDTADGYLVIDLNVCASPAQLKASVLRKRRAPLEPVIDSPYDSLQRIRIPVDVQAPAWGTELTNPRVTMTELCPSAMFNFSCGFNIDPRRVGRPYRFLYSATLVAPRPSNFIDGMCRVDVLTGEVVRWSDFKSIVSGTPVFVPRPGAPDDAETDGVLLVDCMGADGRALFVVLDAGSFAELARVMVPHRHTVSWNSTWVSCSRA